MEAGRHLTFEQFKWLRDTIMEATLTMDSLNSNEQIKLELRFFLQEIRTWFRNAGLLISDIRLAGDHPVNLIRKGTFRNRKIKIIFNMAPPQQTTERGAGTPVKTPEKNISSLEVESDHNSPTFVSAPLKSSTPKRNQNSPIQHAAEPQIDHLQRWKLIKDTIASILLLRIQNGPKRRNLSSTKDVQKGYFWREVQVKNDVDNWASITINNKRGRNIELLFIETCRRQYEFSVDSFQIILDPYLTFAGLAKNFEYRTNFFPTVTLISLTSNFQQAVRDVEKRRIATTKPEEIHGGGLLRQCYLSSMNFRFDDKSQLKLQTLMCSRFFIDYKTIEKQSMEINYFLSDYFGFESDLTAKFDFLMALEAVVEKSTVCLMHHEQRQILNLIVEMTQQTLTDILTADGISTVRPSTKELMKASKDQVENVDLNNNEINMNSLQLVSPPYAEMQKQPYQQIPVSYCYGRPEPPKYLAPNQPMSQPMNIRNDYGHHTVRLNKSNEDCSTSSSLSPYQYNFIRPNSIP